MELTGAQIMMEVLKEEGVETIFGFPGGVVIDLFDQEQKMLVWRGVGTGMLKDPPDDEEEKQRRVDNYINKILDEYPPKK